MRQLRYTALALATVFTVTACGDDDENGPTGPDISDIAGTWTATEFHIQGTGENQNLPIIASGGTFEATIQEDGAFTAEMEIPNPTGPVFEPTLGGTLSLDGETVTVDFDGQTEALPLGFNDFDAEYDLSGDTFTWSANDIGFDFPTDDVDGQEPATIDVTLERDSG